MLTLRPSLGGYSRHGAFEEGQLAVELTAGAMVGKPCDDVDWEDYETGSLRTRCLWLVPEVGYSFRRSTLDNPVHLGSVGLGVGYGSVSRGIGVYTPRFVAGQLGGRPSLGFRHGLSGHFLSTFLSLELAHQVLSTEGVLSHEITLTFGLNFAMASFLLN